MQPGDKSEVVKRGRKRTCNTVFSQSRTIVFMLVLHAQKGNNVFSNRTMMGYVCSLSGIHPWVCLEKWVTYKMIMEQGNQF